MAIEDSGIDLGKIDKSRFGVMVGSAFGGMQTYEEQTLKLASGGPKKVSPFTIPALLGNTVRRHRRYIRLRCRPFFNSLCLHLPGVYVRVCVFVL
jgi:3-oxoacyl-(acyl-carrier-protein) synthase